MDITSIRNDRAKGKIEYMGEEIRFTYRPAMVTPENFSKLNKGDVDEVSEILAGVISSWELTEDKEALPVTASNVSKLPLAIIRSITRAIVDEVPQKDLGNG